MYVYLADASGLLAGVLVLEERVVHVGVELVPGGAVLRFVGADKLFFGRVQGVDGWMGGRHFFFPPSFNLKTKAWGGPARRPSTRVCAK